MLISQTEGYLEIPSSFFRRIYALSVGFKMETLTKKRFRMLRQKPTQVLPLKLLEEATIHFYCRFDEHVFQTSVR